MPVKLVGAMNLYELETELLQLADAYEALGEAPPDDPVAREAWEHYQHELQGWINEQEEGLAEAFGKKVEGYCHLYTDRKRKAEMVSAELARLQARKKSIEGVADRLKGTLHRVMKNLGFGKFETESGTFKLAVCKNGGKEVVKHDGETPVPPELAAPVPVQPLTAFNTLKLYLDYFIADPEFMLKIANDPNQTWAVLGQMGINRPELQPDADAVRDWVKTHGGEVPAGFSLERGDHLRIT